MKCLGCGQDIPENLKTCPYCNCSNQKNNDQKKLMIIMVIGIIIMILLMIVMLIFGREEAIKPVGLPDDKPVITSKNYTTIGAESSYLSPLLVGDTGVASIDMGKDYEMVAVTGIRFIENEEATNLANTYARDPLIEGFYWAGFEYEVLIDDIKGLDSSGISPVLETNIRSYLGHRYVKYGDDVLHYFKTIPIYNGNNLKNGEGARVILIFQINAGNDDWSVCLGDINKKECCFKKNIV